MQPVNYSNLRSVVAFSRPNDTTAYASGDVITSSPAATLVFSSSRAVRNGYITRVTLATDRSTQTEALRLHLFASDPTTPADNAALNLTYAAAGANYLGYVDFTTYVQPGASGFAVSEGQFISRPLQFSSNSGSIFGVLEARAAITPTANQAYTISLFTEASA